jgi:hypothetical protein
MTEPPVSGEEVRNDRWVAMAQMGMTGLEIARLSDVNHSLVYRTLDRLRVPDPV